MWDVYKDIENLSNEFENFVSPFIDNPKKVITGKDVAFAHSMICELEDYTGFNISCDVLEYGELSKLYESFIKNRDKQVWDKQVWDKQVWDKQNVK